MNTERTPLNDKELWRSLAAARDDAPQAVSDLDFAAWLEGRLSETAAARVDAAVAADPVRLRKWRRDNADMMALPRFFYSMRMPRTPALRKPAIPVHCTASAQ